MDPVTTDHVRRWSGKATKDAVPDTGLVAARLGKSDRLVRFYKNGHRSAPLGRYLEWIANVQHPWRESAHIQAFVKFLTVHEEATADLVERWVELSDIEHDCEADQNRHHANGDCPDSEALADERHAAVLLERAAVRRELHIRGVNPRDFREQR